MYKRITEIDDGPFEGYVYTDQNGCDIYVEVYDDLSGVSIKEFGQHLVVYKEDMLKLINALQSAYEYMDK